MCDMTKTYKRIQNTQHNKNSFILLHSQQANDKPLTFPTTCYFISCDRAAYRFDILVEKNDLLNHCKLLFRTRKHQFIYKARTKNSQKWKIDSVACQCSHSYMSYELRAWIWITHTFAISTTQENAILSSSQRLNLHNRFNLDSALATINYNWATVTRENQINACFN